MTSIRYQCVWTACLILLISASIGFAAFYQYYSLEVNCTGRLDRAANANTVVLAHQELKVAVDYLDAHDLTSGNTSLLFHTPKNDIGYWHTNLSASLHELERAMATPEMTQLEESNVLMKLRETLTDANDRGTSVIVPAELPFYPHIFLWRLGIWASVVLSVVSLMYLLACLK